MSEESKKDELSGEMEKLMLSHSGLGQIEKDFNLIDCIPKAAVVP